ncbi:TonB-dependent hemoglobin/transferrin/lactoferrin family receptor [Pseudomonas sp. A6]|uniref:TonB-dependent hemoglobin/transferrin/lactoferrin family receptor n=1 Tax=Pseudomonas sp. A6 TaxID=410021 RepID=UPI004029C7FC
MLSRFTLPLSRPLACAALLGGLLLAEYSRGADLQLALPAQPLSAALGQLAEQAQVQVLFDEAQLQGLQAPAVQGRYGVREALERLLQGTSLELVEAGEGFVVRRRGKVDAFQDNTLQLDSQTIVGTGDSVDASSVGRSTLTRKDIERIQADNIPSLLDTLPGVSMGGSPKPGGQTVNIWGLGDAEDVPFTLDGAPKSGFERYQQGTVFIEPELIKRIEVEKGPHSVFNGNGGFGGTVHMETKDAGDLLRDGKDVGAMLKYGYHSNDQQKIYSGAVYGRSEDRKVDALAYLTARDGRDIKLAGHIPDPEGRYPINPQRLPNSAQDLDAGLFKLNLHPNPDNDLGFSYSRSESTRWTPFSSASYPTPPTQSSIDKYGYEAALKRLLAHRDTTDTTWSGKYQYHPIDNPLLDLLLQYSESHVEQTDERNPDAFFQVATGGQKMDTDYRDKVLELRNTSLFDTGPLQHAFTVGAQLHKHTRDTQMYIPGSTYDTARYNYGHFQPAFMPSGKQLTRSAYVQDALTWGSVTVTPSLRFDQVRNAGKANDAPLYDNPAQGHDYSSQTYSGWSPRLSLFWTATERVAFFADYSRTWRAPVIDEQYEVQNSSTISATSRDLDAERIHALRLGNIVNLPDLFVAGDNLQVRTTLFQNRIKDEIFRTRSVACEQQSIDDGSIGGSCAGMLPLSNYRNLPGATYKGFEIESFYDSERLFAGLSYSWVEGKHDGAYSNPWGPNVWARDVPPAKWVATLGVKFPDWDAQMGWQGEFVRQTDRLPSDKYVGGMGTVAGDSYWDQTTNDSYDTQRVFASWKPRRLGLENTELNLTVDNLFNRDYHPALSGDNVYSQGRNAKFSVTQYF